MSGLLKLAVVSMLASAAGRAHALPPPLFEEGFNRPDGLFVGAAAPASPDWEALSGSLWVSGAAGWTGVPDNAAGSKATGSSVFRLLTRRADFTDTSLGLSLVNRALSATSTTPPVPWDGVHLLLRYQEDGRFYHVAVNRRDDTVIIKKREPGGYHNLTPLMNYAVPYGSRQAVRAAARNEPDGSVLIELYSGQTLLARARDDGSQGGPALAGPGRLGVGGDNCDFAFDDVKVLPAEAADSQPPVLGAVEVPAPTENLATVFWTTDEPADSQVEYGLTPAYGSLTPRGPMVTSHSGSLSGLKKATLYYFRVKSRDAAGNLVVSPAQTFMTGTGVDAQPPEVFVAYPSPGAGVTGVVEVFASAFDDVSLIGVQLRLDGVNLGAEDLQPPYAETWDTQKSANGNHILTAAARDAAGNLSLSAPVTVTVLNRPGSTPGAYP